jgi:hypothetical protein
MVKGAAKTPAAQPSGSTPQPRLPQMGTGLNVAGNPVDSVENVHHVSGLGLRVLGDGERAMATLVTSICTETDSADNR